MPTSLNGFTEVLVPFTHRWDGEHHPFTGAAVIDADGDGRPEVFVGGGQGQEDALLSYTDGQFKDVIAGTGLSDLSGTHGATAIDLDEDGDVDLLVARENGVYLYLNDGGAFTKRLVPLQMPENAVAFDVAVSDFDRDGDADLYVSLFVDLKSFRSATYNDPEHAKTNILLQNNGDLTFTDVTESARVASRQNTFLSVFLDLDGDGWQDLVVAQNTGEIEIFRNSGDARFEQVPLAPEYGLGFWMGLAVGDIDKDGDQDLFFTNVGSSIPSFLTRGDLRDEQIGNLEWLLLRNEGNMQFSDVTQQYGLTDHGFAWGAVLEDLNLDGDLDLLVAQNYIKWPVHKFFKLDGKAFLQLPAASQPAEKRFFQQESLNLGNPYFGQSPLVVDFTGDGRPDVLWINMDGPVRAFANRETGNFVTVELPDTISAQGTVVYLETQAGKSYARQLLNSVGMLTDQSPRLTFGLGDDDQIEAVNVIRPDKSKIRFTNPPLNEIIRVPQ
ncbi:MAG: CRTAC1 family protein [Burkholderiaceae bacterium]